MAQVADYVLARLGEWGVHRVFGCGRDGGGFAGAFERVGDEPELVTARNAAAAAFMACGHARLTGEVGVCVAGAEPDAVRLLNGLYDAKQDGAPVVALVGQGSRGAAGQRQEPDLAALFADVSDYAQVCMTAGQARHLVDQAVRTALAVRGVATVVFPQDVLEEDAQAARAPGVVASGAGSWRSVTVPPAAQVRHAAEVLNAGERVAILAGQGAFGAAAELAEVADLLGAGVAKARLGRDVLPDDLPFVTGPAGPLGSRAGVALLSNCDVLLLVGTGFPHGEWLPGEGRAQVVQIDQDPRGIGGRVPVEAGLAGDARETLRLLIPYLDRKRERAWRLRIETDVASQWQETAVRARDAWGAIDGALVAWELNDRLPGGATVIGDFGPDAAWWGNGLRVRGGMRALVPGTHAAAGAGVPYALAARLADPGRPVVALMEDAAFTLNGVDELVTVKRYAGRLAGAPLVLCVLNGPDGAGGEVPRVPYAAYAELLGLTAIRCADAGEVGAAWERALSVSGPVLLEFVVGAEADAARASGVASGWS